ncbi:protein of unknown function [Microbacterium sp. Nx66]|nr:protein of unknown function [Microbacterium sp. Nx66]
MVVERGSSAGAAVSEWGHARLFSGWPELTDTAARRLLEPTGTAPANGYPTGAEWVSEYLTPLVDVLGDRVLYGTTVTGIARQGRDKDVDSGRKGQPFVVHTVDQDGCDGRILASARRRGQHRLGDRPEHPLLRLRRSHRRTPARAAREGPVHRRCEVLWPRPHLPGAHGLGAGPQRRSSPCRRSRGCGAQRARPSRHRGLRRCRRLRRRGCQLLRHAIRTAQIGARPVGAV